MERIIYSEEDQNWNARTSEALNNCYSNYISHSLFVISVFFSCLCLVFNILLFYAFHDLSCDLKLQYILIVISVINLTDIIHAFLSSKYPKFVAFTDILNHISKIVFFVYFLLVVWSDNDCTKKMPVVYYYVIAFVLSNYFFVIVFKAIILFLLYCGIQLFCPGVTISLVRNIPLSFATTEEEVNDLPLYKYGINSIANIKDNTLINIETDNKTCSICLEDYNFGDLLRYLKCKHFFHKSCIEEWLKISRICPLCRQNIFA